MKPYNTLSKNILVLIICLISISLFGQFTTVIPAVDKGAKVNVAGQSVTFSFNTSMLPANATIQSSKLQMTIGENVRDKLTLDVKISNSRFGYMFLDEFSKTNDIFYIDGLPNQIPRAANVSMTLQVRSEKSSSNITILGNGNFSPRLIITYSMPAVQLADWSMSHANGQHSGSTFMRFGGVSPKAYTGKSISTFGDVQSDLVMYKNKIYVIDNANSKTSLYSLDPITKERKLIADRLLAPVRMPIIDPYGRLFYFSANKVEVIELEKGNAKKDVISIGSTRTLIASPTIGSDGSLYLVFNDAVVAYSPFPVMQKIWQHGSGGTKSSVTLNKEGTLAYFVSYNSNKIFSLSTTNGKKEREASVILKSPGNEGSTIPLVANNGNVFVTNKLFDGDKFYVFSSQLGLQIMVEGSKISLPVSGKGNNVFYVKDGILHNYTSGQQIPFIGNVSVRSLAADLSDNVYCLGSDNKIYVYNSGNNSIAQSPASNTALQRALVIGRDGSAYSATSSKIYGFRISNSSNLASYTLTSNDDQLNNATFVGKNLSVPVNLSLSKNKVLIGVNSVRFELNSGILNYSDIIVESGGTISFRKGFRIEKGASLSCKLEY